MKTSETINKLTEALLNFQKEVKGISKDGKGYNYNYITLDQILELVRPKLAENNITLIQEVSSMILENGKVIDGVTTRLSHTSGEYIETNPLYIEAYAAPKKDGKPQPITPQEHGSAITYAKRYQVTGLLALNADVDDDASQYKQGKTDKNAKNWGTRITDDQYRTLGKLMDIKGATSEDMQLLMSETLKVIKASRELTSEEANKLIDALNAMPNKITA